MRYEPLRQKLLEERARLQKDLEQNLPVVSTEHVGYGTHQADDASDVFEQTRNATLQSQLEWLLGEVEYALAKFEHGTYGTCEACGQEIAYPRLEALPTARFCMNDQQKMEKKVVPA
jgi:DnaK suppressor protein